MAGGTFITQNKVRPGAYINFKAVGQRRGGMGTRGVVTVPLALDWGADGEIIELSATDLIDGTSQIKMGLTAFDQNESAQIVREALKNCPRGLFYRVNTGSDRAETKIGETDGLIITARYGGVFGNRIAVSVAQVGAQFDVVTFVDNRERNRQRVTQVKELQANDWVVFSGEGPLEASIGVQLFGGTKGNASDNNYQDYFAKIKNFNWNTMALPTVSKSLHSGVIALIEDLRERRGIKVQAVLYDKNGADYEGIISVDQGYITESETIEPHVFTAYVAGMTAGAAVNQSNTYHVISGATDIINPATDDEIEKGLITGKLLLSRRIDGAIIIEKDINTLVTFSGNDKSYDFSKNRVIRTLDDIAMFTLTEFSMFYIGKVDNTAGGRNLLKGRIAGYLNELQALNAIQNFDVATDISVNQGADIESVVVDLAIQPVDAMEKLFMTVNVGGTN